MKVWEEVSECGGDEAPVLGFQGESRFNQIHQQERLTLQTLC